MSALWTIAFIFSSSLAQAGNFGTMAYSKKTDTVKVSFGYASKLESEKIAVDACAQTDCIAVVTAENGYLALATGDHSYAAASSESPTAAMQAAYVACQSRTSNCRWRAWISVASDSDHTIVQSDAGPQATSLTQIGGPFKKEIPNFHGFKQLHDKWCWAAATQTIYYALTGAILDQGQLARIHLDADYADTIEEMYHLRRKIENIVCTGRADDRDECNHAGFVQTALQELGVSAPLPMLPSTVDGDAIFLTIRKSLERGVPVGLILHWYSGSAHSIVVYGASYSADKSDAALKKAVIKLKIFDPYDGKSYVMEKNTVKPNYQTVPGNFSGWTYVADYTNEKAQKVSPHACEFLTKSDRDKFCPTSEKGSRALAQP